MNVTGHLRLLFALSLFLKGRLGPQWDDLGEDWSPGSAVPEGRMQLFWGSLSSPVSHQDLFYPWGFCCYTICLDVALLEDPPQGQH